MRISRRAAMTAAGVAGALALGAGVAVAATDDAGADDDVRLADGWRGMGGRMNGGDDAWDARGGMGGHMGGWDDRCHGDLWGDLEGDATAADAASLARMVEEERMARDLYAEAADLWDSRTFARVATAESHHLAAIQRLLEGYGLEDPGEDAVAGEYADAEIQQLYDDLLAQASASVTGAYEAAITVEETDIADLEDADPDSDAIDAVYDRLATASARHLEVFEEALANAAP